LTFFFSPSTLKPTGDGTNKTLLQALGGILHQVRFLLSQLMGEFYSSINYDMLRYGLSHLHILAHPLRLLQARTLTLQLHTSQEIAAYPLFQCDYHKSVFFP